MSGASAIDFEDARPISLSGTCLTDGVAVHLFVPLGPWISRRPCATLKGSGWPWKVRKWPPFWKLRSCRMSAPQDSRVGG